MLPNDELVKPSNSGGTTAPNITSPSPSPVLLNALSVVLFPSPVPQPTPGLPSLDLNPIAFMLYSPGSIPSESNVPGTRSLNSMPSPSEVNIK